MALLRYRLVSLLVILLASGCATVSRQNAIEVFKKYNQVTSDIMFIAPDLEDHDPLGYVSLSEAEMRMHEVCQPLNDLAVAHVDGENPGILKKISAARKVNACERETRRVDSLISKTVQ